MAYHFYMRNYPYKLRDVLEEFVPQTFTMLEYLKREKKAEAEQLRRIKTKR